MDTPLHLSISKHEEKYGRSEKLFECLGAAFLHAYLISASGETLRNRSLLKLIELPDAHETISAQQQLSSTLRQEVIKSLDGDDTNYFTDVRRKLQELCRGEPSKHSLDRAIYTICARNLFSAEISSWENASIQEIGEQVYESLHQQKPTSGLAEIQTLMKGIGAYTGTYGRPGK